MIRRYRFNAPIYEQFVERTSGLEVVHYGGQEFDLDEQQALDPRLEVVGEAVARAPAEAVDTPEPAEEQAPLASLSKPFSSSASSSEGTS